MTIFNTKKTMILSAHQPAYLPWLGYFHKIAISDSFVILDDVQFEKNSFINRNKIKTAQGYTWLTMPVLISGHTKKTISQIEINNKTVWQKKHWKSIYFNYKKSPYFYKYADFFEDFYRKDWVKLHDAIDNMLCFLIKELGIETDLYKQSDMHIQSKKQGLVLELCKKLKSHVFVFGALGRDYAEASLFENNGINIFFQDYKHPSYHQLHNDFTANLSIIDLLFNVEKERMMEIIMDNNITKKELRMRFTA